MSRAAALSIAALLLASTLMLAYANHFDNGFYFDDAHTVVNNLWIRDLANIGEFFSNPETSSTLPPNRQYRPLVTLSLAIDYWLGGRSRALLVPSEHLHLVRAPARPDVLRPAASLHARGPARAQRLDRPVRGRLVRLACGQRRNDQLRHRKV